MQRILSPRAASETIAEAHRLWASEISAVFELRGAKDAAEKEALERKYEADLKRLSDVISADKAPGVSIGKLPDPPLSLRKSNSSPRIEPS
jgi:hypothetical protein